MYEQNPKKQNYICKKYRVKMQQD